MDLVLKLIYKNNVYKTNFFSRLWKVFIYMYLLFPFKLTPMRNLQVGVYYFCILLGDIYIIYEHYKNQILRRNLFDLFLFWCVFIFMIFLSISIPFFYKTNDYSFFSHISSYVIRLACMSVFIINCNNIDNFLRTIQKPLLFMFFLHLSC